MGAATPEMVLGRQVWRLILQQWRYYSPFVS